MLISIQNMFLLHTSVRRILEFFDDYDTEMQDSTYQLKQSVQKRDKKLVILTEKMNAQFQLFDSIEKEAAAVKQAVNTIEDIVNGKEQEGSFLTNPYSPSLQFRNVPVFVKHFKLSNHILALILFSQ